MLNDHSYLQSQAEPAAVIHITVPSDQIQEVMGPAIHEVIKAVTEQGIGPKGAVFAHHFGMTPGIFNFEVGVPISGTLKPIGRVKAGELPASLVASTIYTGPYEGLGNAWGEFQKKIEAEGRTLGASLWERYFYGPESTGDSSTYRTELNQTVQP